MSTRLPKPETLIALLPSFGYGPGKPVITKHVYSRTLECNLPSPDGEAYEFEYTCTVTGAARRWGTCDRDFGITDDTDN